MDASRSEGGDRSPWPDDDAADGWPTIEVDLSRSGGRARDERPGPTTRRPERHDRWPLGRRLGAALAAATLGVAGAVLLLGDARTGTSGVEPTPAAVERSAPVVSDAVGDESHDGNAVGTAPVAAREVGTLAVGDQVSGSDRALVLVDADGLRYADLAGGTVTDAKTLGPVGGPVLTTADSGAVVFVSGDTVEEVDAAGIRRTVGPAHGVVVGLGRRHVWMLDQARDRRVLTAVQRSSGAVEEQITLSVGETLVGFHGGRPLAASGDLVVRLRRDGAAVAVTHGRVVAVGGANVLVRRCGPSCDEAVVVDLDERREHTVALDAEVQAFGLGDALSPDGRWLVGLVFAEGMPPRLAVHPLVAPGEVAPDPLLLSVGVLGFGGRAAGVTWSPDSTLLAAPGSSRVALVDVARRSTLTIPIRLTGSGPTVRWLSP